MTGPIDIHALKAAALDPTKHRTHDDRVMMVARSDVLALIERLETAEHRLMSLGYRRACDIPPCNCGDRWAHKLACPSKCSCDKCELDRAGIALDILRDELRADRARLEKLASLLREWRAAKFFDTRERWLSWVEEFGPRVDAALAALEDSP